VPFLLKGVVITIELTVMAAVLAFIMSFIAGFARLSKYAIVRVITQIYVEVFRGTSLLVQLFWVYFVLPFFGIELSAMMTGVLVLGLNYGAYGSEVIRSSILAIPKGQIEAGIALNMSSNLIMRKVILPQALLIMLPPLGNYLI
jgi:polar amino acid transport system permease protein